MDLDDKLHKLFPLAPDMAERVKLLIADVLSEILPEPKKIEDYKVHGAKTPSEKREATSIRHQIVTHNSVIDQVKQAAKAMGIEVA